MNRLMDWLSDVYLRTLARLAIHALRTLYGADCPPDDFEPECASCQAALVVKKLKEFLEVDNA